MDIQFNQYMDPPCLLVQISNCEGKYTSVIPLPSRTIPSCTTITKAGEKYLIVDFAGEIEHMWLNTIYSGALSLCDVNYIGIADIRTGQLLFNATRGYH